MHFPFLAWQRLHSSLQGSVKQTHSRVTPRLWSERIKVCEQVSACFVFLTCLPCLSCNGFLMGVVQGQP